MKVVLNSQDSYACQDAHINRQERQERHDRHDADMNRQDSSQERLERDDADMKRDLRET